MQKLPQDIESKFKLDSINFTSILRKEYYKKITKDIDEDITESHSNNTTRALIIEDIDTETERLFNVIESLKFDCLKADYLLNKN